MAKCKNCLHLDVCNGLYFNLDQVVERDCRYFKDRSKFTEVVHGRWIPVSEEIPEQYHSVIGWTKFKEIGEVMHDGKKFVWTDEESVPAFVTHWMPFPTPPERM